MYLLFFCDGVILLFDIILGVDIYSLGYGLRIFG